MKHVVPVTVSLLKEGKVDIRSANERLLVTLRNLLGDDALRESLNHTQSGTGLSSVDRGKLSTILSGF